MATAPTAIAVSAPVPVPAPAAAPFDLGQTGDIDQTDLDIDFKDVEKFVKKIFSGSNSGILVFLGFLLLIVLAVILLRPGLIQRLCRRIGATRLCRGSGTIFDILDNLGGNTRDLTQDSEESQCFLMTPADTTQDNSPTTTTTTTTMLTQAQEQLQAVATRMEDHTDFSNDKLRSLYSSLLYGLLDESDQDDDEIKQEIDGMIEQAIGFIDTNNDGTIDVWEMENIALPRETGEFLFDDVVACTTPEMTPEDACVTADNVIAFLNMFYGGTQVVSPALAQHIRDESGTDSCFTRPEFEASFTTAEDLETLSAGMTSQPMDLTFVLTLAFGVGTALYVSRLSSSS